MAPLLYFNLRKVLHLYLVLFLFPCIFLCVNSSQSSQIESKEFVFRRRMLGMEKDQDDQIKPKKMSTNLSAKNQTKLLKPTLSTKNQTKLINTSSSAKNQTKIAKSTNSISSSSTTSSKLEIKKLNSTSQLKKLNSTSHLKKLNSTSQLKKLNSTSQLKKLNSSSKSYNSTKKTSDLLKLGPPKNKTTKPISPIKEKKLSDPNQSQKQKPIQKKASKAQKVPSWVEQDVEDDLVSELRDLPSKFQETILPDFERISTASKKYLTKANKEMTKGFKPIIGNKYASITATVVSFAFILIPLLLVSLVINRIKAYFSIQKIVIFIQVYLSIYFSILCFSSIVTGLEPLRFFYATSQSTYICLMVLQTLGYVLYLLLLLMYLILVFSTDSGLSSKLLGLGQLFVGFSVGLHFYVAVFHRVVLHQPPKTNWKIHGIYATCFLVICLFANLDRKKKAYLGDGGEEGKKN